MKNFKKIFLKANNGITLIALVITIIVLLILAGIGISMLSGDNGVLKQAGNAKTKTDIAQEKELLQTASLAAISKEKYGELSKDKLDDELDNYSEVENTEQINNGILVTFKSNRTYLVDFDGDVSIYNDIIIGNLVVKDGNTKLTENCKSVQLGKALTINFDASIANGQIISISPNIAFTTTGERSKTFTIAARTSEGKEITKDYIVNLKGYYNIPDLKVGDFVIYKLNTPTEEQLAQLNSDLATYSGNTDNTEKTSVGDTLLCRVLEMDSNGNPTKLISAKGENILRLGGQNGYNNAVYLINEMCTTLYSGNQGTTGSLTIEDLENNYFSNEAIATRDNSSGSVGYGQTQYYYSSSGYTRYPIIARYEARMGIETTLVDGKNTIRTDGLDLSQQYTTYIGQGNAAASTVAINIKGMTVTQTYYEINQGDNNYKSATLNNIMHKIPKANSSKDTNIYEYWIASRCVDTGSTSSYRFCVRSAAYNKVSGVGLKQTNSSCSVSCALRPIITLEPGIQAEYIEAYNTLYNTWSL